MDEVQTGGGTTGKFWCHEHFDLDEPVDIVTYSKKMLIGGYFSLPDFRPREGYRIFNTWMGEPSKILLLEKVVQVVQRDNLLENAQITGQLFSPSSGALYFYITTQSISVLRHTFTILHIKTTIITISGSIQCVMVNYCITIMISRK